MLSQAVDSEDFDQLMLSKQAEAQQHNQLSDYPVPHELPNHTLAPQPSASLPPQPNPPPCAPLADGPQCAAPTPPSGTGPDPGHPPPPLRTVGSGVVTPPLLDPALMNMLLQFPVGAVPLQPQGSDQLKPCFNPAVMPLPGWPCFNVPGPCLPRPNAPASAVPLKPAGPSGPGDRSPEPSPSVGTAADSPSEEPSSSPSGKGTASQSPSIGKSAISDADRVGSKGTATPAGQLEQPPKKAKHQDATESQKTRTAVGSKPVTPKAPGPVLKELTAGQAASRGNSLHAHQGVPCTPRAGKTTEKASEKGQAARKTPVSKSKLGGSKRSISVRSPAGMQSVGSKDKPGRPSKLSRKELQYKEH